MNDRNRLLDGLAKQAAEIIVGPKGPKAALSIIQSLAPDSNSLELVSVYPPELLPELKVRIGRRDN